MQPTTGTGTNTSSGTLHRFRSAPASWLEALLEGDEEESLKPNQSLSQLLVDSPSTTNQEGSSSFASSSLVDPDLFEPGFQRQNSSPADFLGSSGVDNDAYLSSFAANYDFAAPNVDASLAGKRSREMEVKGEHSGQMPGGGSSLIDMEIEKIMEDSVPFKVRAKRGCATHPRSIAERVRRTRISDRIRKLQELVPNMDKQTNTADMLDEAVEYVKFLRRQIEELTEQQRKCQCTAKDQ